VRNEATYIEEWVAFHRKQGVSRFLIYDNGSVDGTPESLRKLGIEPVIWADLPAKFDPQQQAAYREGAQALAGFAAWVAFIDIDEFLFGRHGRTLAEVLSEFPAHISAIAVQQRVFGSNGQATRLPGSVLERFTRCAVPDHPEHLWFKTIARPEQVLEFSSVHSVVSRGGAYVLADGLPFTLAAKHPGEASRHAEGTIALHHYMLRSFEEFREKQAKWSERTAETRLSSDNYFIERETYANAVECRDALDWMQRSAAPAGQTVPRLAAPHADFEDQHPLFRSPMSSERGGVRQAAVLVPSAKRQSGSGAASERSATVAAGSIHRTDGTLVRTNIDGYLVTFFVKDRSDEIQRHHFAGRFYGQEELQIIARYFKPEEVFVDIGANVGNHTIYAAKHLRARRVIPFETRFDAIEILLTNVALNKCNNVDTSYLGFGVVAHDQPLPERPITGSNSGPHMLIAGAEPGLAYRTIRPDAVIAHSPVDFIKMDIEGMEMEAWDGLEETVVRWRPRIFVAIHTTELESFRAWTDMHKYKIAERIARHEHKANYLIVAA
jgi:FkbM family methyltransferase